MSVTATERFIDLMIQYKISALKQELTFKFIGCLCFSSISILDIPKARVVLVFHVNVRSRKKVLLNLSVTFEKVNRIY